MIANNNKTNDLVCESISTSGFRRATCLLSNCKDKLFCIIRQFTGGSNLTELNETDFLCSSESYCLYLIICSYLYFKIPSRLTTWSNKSFLRRNRMPILAHRFCLSLLRRLSLASSWCNCFPHWLHSFLMASRAISRRTAVLKVGLETGGIRSQSSCSTGTSG